MLPENISDEIRSSGEKIIFDLFKCEPQTDDWVVMHSMLLGKHTKNRWGEIDFIVLAPNLGIFVLEVKSGRVERHEGIWRYTDRHGYSHDDPRGPFNQAREAMYTLKNYISERYGKDSAMDRLLMNYAVIFPHVKHVPAGIEIENFQLLIDLLPDNKGKIGTFIRNLSHQTLIKQSTKSGYYGSVSLPNKNKLMNF